MQLALHTINRNMKSLNILSVSDIQKGYIKNINHAQHNHILWFPDSIACPSARKHANLAFPGGSALSIHRCPLGQFISRGIVSSPKKKARNCWDEDLGSWSPMHFVWPITSDNGQQALGRRMKKGDAPCSLK